MPYYSRTCFASYSLLTIEAMRARIAIPKIIGIITTAYDRVCFLTQSMNSSCIGLDVSFKLQDKTLFCYGTFFKTRCMDEAVRILTSSSPMTKWTFFFPLNIMSLPPRVLRSEGGFRMLFLFMVASSFTIKPLLVSSYIFIFDEFEWIKIN